MKPKRQEDSSCRFCLLFLSRHLPSAFLLTVFVAALAIAAIPQEKKERRNLFGADQEKGAL